MSMFDLKGKVAVITGASCGLGADAARDFAREGANVALLARRKEKLDAVAAECKEIGVDAIAVPCDVRDEEAVKAAIAEVFDHYGRIDILINNAGVAVRGGVDSMTEEEWNLSFDTNVKGIFFVSKYVVPHMIEQKYGKIVNVASVNAIIADKNDIFIRHSYNASKAAVVGLTKGMAASYGKYNITVNAVGPGLFKSEMTENTLFKSEPFLAGYNMQCPLGRPGNTGEVSGPMMFFSSDLSGYVTGQYITIDGGTSIV